MTNFTLIEQKLKQFSRKYYTNELIKGSILFIIFGLLYLLFTLFIEYFLWLNTTARTVLFWLFIAVEVFLLVRFIGFPIFKLFGLRKGISEEESSKIIGNHFPEVKDKLLNVLQLKQNDAQSDLLAASIAQKSKELQPIQFKNAINFSKNTTYLKYILIPILIFIITLFTGNKEKLSNSFKRVVNHDIAYTPPALFTFSLTNENLENIQGKPVTIYVQAKGELVPDAAKIHYENQEYFLQNEGNGMFSYTFDEVNKATDFYIEANGIKSKNFNISIIKTPTIQNVSMRLVYPRYVEKTNEDVPNTGNVTVPQGTTITWKVKTTQTNQVTFINKDKRTDFKEANVNNYKLSKRILKSINYKIATSNSNLKEYEQLQFSINTIKDELPNITVKSNIDSISRGTAFFAGQLSDDYGISKLEMVYYDSQNPQNQITKPIKTTKSNVQSFFYEFPKGIDLAKGVNYELYFQVFDNDAVSGNKKVKSRKFSYKQKTETEVNQELLQEQKEVLKDLNNSLEKQQKNKKELEKLQFDLQNKKNINWNDKKKVEKLVKRQQSYKKMMQRQTKKLQENFSEKKEKTPELQQKKVELQKRVEELKKLEKQQKLLDELMKMAEKLNKEELVKKAKELAQQNKQQEKSLERVLEMTKRFYVEQKMTQIADKLEKLAKKQEVLAEKETKKEAQEEIKKEFEKLQEEVKDLKKENEKLKEPMDVPSMEELKRDTKKELKKADENLAKDNKEGAKKNQKKAAKNMQEMSKKIQASMQAMSAEMQEENMEGLRQVLENLIKFSFNQETLMNNFDGTTTAHPNFGKNLRKQHQLKTYFEHIDDSLFTLSMRVPKISSKIDEQLSAAHYNLEQSLDNIANNKIRPGVSNQQYVMTAANILADMLSNTLDSMKNPKSGKGKGKGKGKSESFSLPDIIKKQSDLLKKMQKGMPKGGKSGKGKKGENGKPKDGKGNKQGNSDTDGEKMNGDLYQIYKEQSELRQELEEALKGKGGNNGAAKKALKEMEQLENDILEKGLTQGNIQRMQNLKQQLLKLDKATFEQGEDKKRKATSNTLEYNNNTAKKLEFKKRYYNQTEILNRQSLPLQPNYKKKVKAYFNILDNNKK